MDVGGGMAVGGVGMAAPAFTCPSAGVNGPLGDVNTAALRGATAGPLQNLVQTLADFSSAEILMALMLAAAAGKSRKREDDDIGLGLLMGLALAQRLTQSVGNAPAVPPPCDIGAASGGQLNAVA